MAGPGLKQYRWDIRKAWLPVVGRAKLNSHEYELIEQWFNEGVRLGLILKAIKQVAERGHTVYSLGVISADLEALKREYAKNQVGAAANKSDMITPPVDAWRTRWIEDLTETAAEMETLDPTGAARLRKLAEEIPELTREQAQRRWQQLHS